MLGVICSRSHAKVAWAGRHGSTRLRAAHLRYQLVNCPQSPGRTLHTSYRPASTLCGDNCFHCPRDHSLPAGFELHTTPPSTHSSPLPRPLHLLSSHSTSVAASSVSRAVAVTVSRDLSSTRHVRSDVSTLSSEDGGVISSSQPPGVR